MHAAQVTWPTGFIAEARLLPGCREVARAVAGGAEINACCTGQPAMDLIRDTNALAGGANLEPPTSTANLTALHFACQVCLTAFLSAHDWIGHFLNSTLNVQR